MVRLTADGGLHQENEVLKLLMNSLLVRLRKVVVECLGYILGLLLLHVGICIIYRIRYVRQL